MAQLGANADGEVLVPGRVGDCYLDPADDGQAVGVLVVAPAALAASQQRTSSRWRSRR